jgi:hypothetical protein
MKTGATLVLVAMIVAQPVCVFGASYGFAPNPVGEKVYTAQLFARMKAPLAIIAGGFSLAWVLNRVRRRGEKLPPDQGRMEPSVCDRHPG